MSADAPSLVFLVLGAALMAIAALGVFRFPDLYTRLHANSKASTLGLGLMLLGVAARYPSASVIVKVIAIIFFVLITAPIAAHAIARSHRKGMEDPDAGES